MTVRLLLTVVLLAIFSPHIYAETARFDVTRDIWISAYPGEENFNMGAATRLKLKGIQEMALLDFDLSSLRGKNIEGARLYLCDASNKNRLRKIGISTVASPWVEGKSTDYAIDEIGNGATFLYASHMKQRWGGEGSDLTDVTMGNGNTWQHHTELQRGEEGWWSVDVAPTLIEALIAGKSYGLLIMDESGQTFANNFLFSRESRHSSPYLAVTFSETQRKRPQRLEVGLSPSPENAHIGYGAIVLRIPVKEDLFAFDIYTNGEDIPLWRVPKPGPPNKIQEIILDWLPPEKKVDIKVMGVDRLGQRSEPTGVTGYASRSLPRITLPVFKSESEGGQAVTPPTEARPVRSWAVPELTKVDPLSGEVFSEVNSAGFDQRNPIWSSDKREITLGGAKGETIGFQVVVETGSQVLDELQFKVTPLISYRGERIPEERFTLYQLHYLKVKEGWQPELAIPMREGRLAMKASERSVQGQKNQSIYVDLSIPSEAQAGSYKGDISIQRKGGIVDSFHVTLKVADILMPKRLSFVPELNMYRGPAETGTERFFKAHRIAHEHRSVINRVPYNQDGTVHHDMIPQISYSRDGQIKIDWTEYDQRLGPLFDGTAFPAGERKGVPVERFYLPFFENWPTPIAENYSYRYVDKKREEDISRHALEAPDMDKAFTSGYKERFVQVIKEFKDHFEKKGWAQTEFQFYLNNKWRWKGASSWWNLDEPLSHDDWTALRFFGSLFHQAKGSASIPLIFRADISRPQWQHDWLNGVLERMYVQDKEFFKNPERIRRIAKEGHIRFSVYGSLNGIGASNYQNVLWCMAAFAEGAEGVLPWQSIGGSKAFLNPDVNALIVDAREAVGVDWVASLRVKALRRCQQNVEFLTLIEGKYGYNREEVRDLFYEYFGRDLMSAEIDTYRMENFRKALMEKILTAAGPPSPQ